MTSSHCSRGHKMQLRGSKADQYNWMLIKILYMTREDEITLERCSRKRSTGSSVPRVGGRGDDGGETGWKSVHGLHLGISQTLTDAETLLQGLTAGSLSGPPGRGSLVFKCVPSDYNKVY